jgi:hypothetical protein
MNKFNLYLLLIASIFIVAASCNVEVVEAPSEIQQLEKSKAACTVNLLGIVTDANTLQPIEGAVVKLGSSLVTTKKDGKYFFKVSDILHPDSVELVVVNKTGYVLSNYQFSIKDRVNLAQCQGNTWDIIQDFPLSPILPGIKITPAGGKFSASTQIGVINEKGEQVISNFDFVVDVPAGAVDQETIISISPISDRSSLGESDDTVTIAGFNLSPSTVQLKSPISITFKPNIKLTAQIKLFPLFFDEAKNKLVTGNGQVSYNAASNLITLVANKMGSFFVGSNITITVSQVSRSIVNIGLGIIENCDCGSLNIKTAQYNAPSINFTAAFDAAGRDKVLKFLNVNYDPTNIAKLSSDVTVEKCSTKAYTITATQVITSGLYGDQPWNLTSYESVSLQPTTTQKCSVTTPCHQGCPQ